MYRKAGQDIISPVASARIVTSDSFSFTYGVVEIRAKMPKGDWLAPGTIWLITIIIYYNHTYYIRFKWLEMIIIV